MKRSYCHKKEDFVYKRKVLFSYIALHLHIFVCVFFICSNGRKIFLS